MTKLCSISVDLDSFWVLARFHGYSAEPKDRTSFYKLVVPRFVEIFKKHRVSATFFVVGKDLEDEENAKEIRLAAEEGFEVANHTYSHPFGMSRLTYPEKEEEIVRCEELVLGVVGKRPVGFRAPGYDIDDDIIEILEDRGYLYDSSVLPSFLLPGFNILQKLRFWKRRKIAHGMDNLRTAFSPNRAYVPQAQAFWRRGNGRSIIEIPLTVVPFLALPFYANFHLSFGRRFFDLGYPILRNRDICYLFHGIELVDPRKDSVPMEVVEHPNVEKPLAEKVAFYDYVLSAFCRDYRVVSMKSYAEMVACEVFDSLTNRIPG